MSALAGQTVSHRKICERPTREVTEEVPANHERTPQGHPQGVAPVSTLAEESHPW